MARFNFELGEEAARMLDTLATWTDRGRRAEVIRDALAIYEALLRRARMGNKFFYGPDPRHLTELDIVALSHARHKALGEGVHLNSQQSPASGAAPVDADSAPSAQARRVEGPAGSPAPLRPRPGK